MLGGCCDTVDCVQWSVRITDLEELPYRRACGAWAVSGARWYGLRRLHDRRSLPSKPAMSAIPLQARLSPVQDKLENLERQATIARGIWCLQRSCSRQESTGYGPSDCGNPTLSIRFRFLEVIPISHSSRQLESLVYSSLNVKRTTQYSLKTIPGPYSFRSADC